ncbi:MAG TPA: UDP-2,3-diacylglucosamine diphosphatase LpxI [Bacillota bacterium]|nr:UDP-2,3-diacylglucosamine diphosphatase LpxI [Bacillota bacterium]
MRKLGLIAGEGELPAIMARNASLKGLEIVVISVCEEIDPEVALVASGIHIVDLDEMDEALEILKNEGISEVAMIGKVWRKEAYRPGVEEAVEKLAHYEADRADTSLLAAFVKNLGRAGIRVANQLEYLGDAVPERGVLGCSEPSPAEWDDISFGFKKAKAISGAGIGQTVIVKNLSVVAVEAAEGTDEAIARAGRLAGGCVVVKVAWQDQDMRFDIPTVGPDTIKVMLEAEARVLAIEAGKTIIVRKEDTLAFANEAGIPVVAVGEVETLEDNDKRRRSVR